MKQGYGQTETSILTCLDADRALTKAGSVGHPVRHAEVRLVDPETIEGDVEDWRDVAPSVVGEIVVRGPITMLEYWHRPEATAETLRGEWLRTGDLATRDEDFDITLVGRAREMYISGGENVYPAEVEAAIDAFDSVRSSAVIGLPDEDLGQRVHAIVDAPERFEEEKLRAHLSVLLAHYKIPRTFERVAEPLRDDAGKLRRLALREARLSGSQGRVG